MADGANLALCEESRERNPSQLFGRRCRIMMGSSKESATSTATTKHECTESRSLTAGPVGGQQRVQFFAG
jgi:hypothetical protein